MINLPYEVRMLANGSFCLMKVTKSDTFAESEVVHELLAQSAAGAEREAIIYLREKKII